MMKKTALFLISLFAVITLWAGPISKEQAGSLARQFLMSHGRSLSQSENVYRSQKFNKSSEQSYYYVFNSDNDQGYVIVSGDDRTATILGYTESGSFDVDNIPDNMRAWLKGYEEQIKYLDDNNVTVSSATAVPALRAIETARHAVKPLIKSKWNQGSPYNLKCPNYYNEDGTLGSKCASGCVATALTQAINYYKYPEQLVAAIPQHSFTSNGKTITLPAIAKGSKIDWDNMCDTYSSSNTEEENMAVADLMLYAGQGVKMGYGPSSGAAMSNCITALKNYFGYDDGVTLEERHKYSRDEWIDLIYNEIATGHPVVYSGSTSEGAHAFILDGYDGSDLFHVNWGWGGGSDGYFLIQILNPGDNSGIGASSSSDGYSMGQNAIIGMRYPDDIKADNPSQLSINDTRVSGKNIISNYVNWSGAAGTFNIGLGEILEDGTLKYVSGLRSVTLGVNNYQSLTLVTAGLSPGIHKIVPMSRIRGSYVWKTSFNTHKEYIIADVESGSKITLTYYHAPVDLKVDTLKVLSKKLMGKEQLVELTLENRSTEYYDEIHLFASKTEDKGEQRCRSAVCIKNGEKVATTYYFTPEEAGLYNLWFTFDNEGNDVLYQTTLDIPETDEDAPNLQISSVTFSNTSNNNVYGDFITGKVTIANKGTTRVDDIVRVNIWKAELDVNSFWQQKGFDIPMVIEPGKSASASFTFYDLETRKQYGFNFALRKQGMEIPGGGLGNVRKLYPGVICYLNDGTRTALVPSYNLNLNPNSVAVDFRGVKSVSAIGRKSYSSNCLYLFDSGTKIPTAIAAKNIVVDGKISKLELKDDAYGFFSPIDIAVDTLSYSRVLTKGLNGKGWEALTLPFVPDEVTLDDKPISIRTADNENGTLSIKSFASLVDGSQVTFSYPQELSTEIPYIFSVNGAQPEQTLKFAATDATLKSNADINVISSTSAYAFNGIYNTSKLTGTYQLNEEGTAFKYVEDAIKATPFSAYFTTRLSDANRADSISIPDEIFTAIHPIIASGKDESFPVYTLDGIKVGMAHTENGNMVLPKLQRGVYLIKGKKYVR